MRYLNRLLPGSFQVSEETGFVVVTVAFLLVPPLGFGALAVDISSLIVVKNELQNAADAGALAATRVLYLNNGQQVNPGPNAVGVNAATANSAQNVAVELTGGDVQRGHWSWSTRTFTPNPSLAAVSLFNVTTADLDANLDFINAVRVRVRREAVPARVFLSRVMGFSDFPMQAEAVAYIGFSGTILPGEADQPIAICVQSLLNPDGSYSCSTGRMINSGGGNTNNTGGWTNFTQGPCATASTPTVRPYVGCSGSPSPEVNLGEYMGSTGGQIQNVWDNFLDCWKAISDTDADGYPDTVYNMTLPVIDCPGNNVGNCSETVCVVNVNLLWMIRIASDPGCSSSIPPKEMIPFNWAPIEMTGTASFPDWECPWAITGGLGPEALSEAQFRACWANFVDYFNLVNYEGVSINTFSDSDLNKSMFFSPDCDAHIPTGGTGGRNFGVLAKIPVLVK